MAQPEYIGSGVVPQRSDTMRMLHVKWLNKLGGLALKSDTLWMLLQKILKRLRGDCILPLAPSSLHFTLIGGGNADLAWSAFTDPASDFLVSWGTHSGGPYDSGSTTFGPSLRSGTITGLDPVVEYWAVIVARNSAGCMSDNSNEVDLNPS